MPQAWIEAVAERAALEVELVKQGKDGVPAGRVRRVRSDPAFPVVGDGALTPAQAVALVALTVPLVVRGDLSAGAALRRAEPALGMATGELTEVLASLRDAQFPAPQAQTLIRQLATLAAQPSRPASPPRRPATTQAASGPRLTRP